MYVIKPLYLSLSQRRYHRGRSDPRLQRLRHGKEHQDHRGSGWREQGLRICHLRDGAGGAKTASGCEYHSFDLLLMSPVKRLPYKKKKKIRNCQYYDFHTDEAIVNITNKLQTIERTNLITLIELFQLSRYEKI